MTSTFADPTPVPAEPAFDPVSAILADFLRELIWTGVRSSARSMQAAIGMSEVGAECDRQLAYKLSDTTPVALDGDPMPVIMGTGFHLHMEQIFGRLDPRRFLVETKLSYRGITGTADLYDRRRRLLVDWKSTSKSKLRRIRSDGPTLRQEIQLQLYGQALKEAGEDPQRLALAFVARDGSLDDLYVWSTVPRPEVADIAITRLHDIGTRAQTEGPQVVPSAPSLGCKYCPFHSPASTDLTRACPGTK